MEESKSMKFEIETPESVFEITIDQEQKTVHVYDSVYGSDLTFRVEEIEQILFSVWEKVHNTEMETSTKVKQAKHENMA